jgi:hypothetical protein
LPSRSIRRGYTISGTSVSNLQIDQTEYANRSSSAGSTSSTPPNQKSQIQKSTTTSTYGGFSSSQSVQSSGSNNPSRLVEYSKGPDSAIAAKENANRQAFEEGIRASAMHPQPSARNHLVTNTGGIEAPGVEYGTDPVDRAAIGKQLANQQALVEGVKRSVIDEQNMMKLQQQQQQQYMNGKPNRLMNPATMTDPQLPRSMSQRSVLSQQSSVASIQSLNSMTDNHQEVQYTPRVEYSKGPDRATAKEAANQKALIEGLQKSSIDVRNNYNNPNNFQQNHTYINNMNPNNFQQQNNGTSPRNYQMNQQQTVLKGGTDLAGGSGGPFMMNPNQNTAIRYK